MSIALDADLERRIVDKVESGEFGSPSEVISAGLALLEARTLLHVHEEQDGSKPLGGGLDGLLEEILAISQSVPDEEWAKLPTDAAMDPDKYLYSRDALVGK